MIFASAVGLVLTLCMVAAYLWLIRRLFQVKAALPVLKLKDGLGRLKGTRTRLAVLGALFFLAWFGSQFSVKVWSPDMLMVFNYEEAARGQNPNVTRFNESGILAEPILEEVIQRGDLELTTEELAGLLTISTPLDAEKLDAEQESSLKISTEYWIHCSERAALYHTQPKTVLNLLADAYWEDFVRNYAENDSVLDLSFDELERMKEMAAHDVRIEAIDMYNAYMTRFVLIPTYDEDREFYMSKTKVGVDYFADEAKEHLESATELLEEMEHNSYASAQVGAGRRASSARAQADRRIEELKTELEGLSDQCRELCAAYVREKRDGYIQVCFRTSSALKTAASALAMTVLFAAPVGGLYILKPFYQECINSRPPRGRGKKGRAAENRGEAAS